MLFQNILKLTYPFLVSTFGGVAPYEKTTPSTSIPSEQWSPTFIAAHFEHGIDYKLDEGVLCLANLGDDVYLAPPDRITCSDGETTMDVAEDPSATEGHRLPFHPEGTYTFRLERANGEVIESAIQMPKATVILSPQHESQFKPGAPITIEWTDVASTYAFRMISIYDKDHPFGGSCGLLLFPKRETETSLHYPLGHTLDCKPGEDEGDAALLNINAHRISGMGGDALLAAATGDKIRFLFIK